MHVKIQQVEFKRRDIIVSVGFFQRQELRPLFDGVCRPYYIEAYEPKKDVCEAYLQMVPQSKRFKVIQKAVSGINGTMLLKLRTTKSTICPINFDPQAKHTYYEVETVSMASVLNTMITRFGKINKLLLNCEGSEIPIIMNTPTSLFKKCEFIFVQFHPFIKDLNITIPEVKRCIKKLDLLYSNVVYNKRYYKYGFTRR